MESKHLQQQASEIDAPHKKSLGDTANRLADIELKIDHLIESIHDSLFRLNQGRNNREELQ